MLSGGGFEGDFVAEGFELADVVAFLPAGIDAVVLEIGAEVDVANCGVGQRMPDDDHDGPGDRDQGLEPAQPFDQAAVPLPQEGVGLGRGQQRRRSRPGHP